MRGISEMYLRSGGTNYQHHCKECCNFKIIGKREDCSRHPELRTWKGSYVACKYFDIPPEEIPGQMNIEQFITKGEEKDVFKADSI